MHIQLSVSVLPSKRTARKFVDFAASITLLSQVDMNKELRQFVIVVFHFCVSIFVNFESNILHTWNDWLPLQNFQTGTSLEVACTVQWVWVSVVHVLLCCKELDSIRSFVVQYWNGVDMQQKSIWVSVRLMHKRITKTGIDTFHLLYEIFHCIRHEVSICEYTDINAMKTQLERHIAFQSRTNRGPHITHFPWWDSRVVAIGKIDEWRRVAGLLPSLKIDCKNKRVTR
jgi:hypothetical protein